MTEQYYSVNMSDIPFQIGGKPWLLSLARTQETVCSMGHG
jgi:hypothetical protein